LEAELRNTVSRHGASEVHSSGLASSADGRRRSAAAAGHLIEETCVPRRDAEGPKLPWLKAMVSVGGIRQRELSDPPVETGSERRCRAALHAPRGGSHRPRG